MNQISNCFRVGFTYSNLNPKGKVIKDKKQIIVSAVNYTDAEQVALAILPDLQNHSDEVEYEIKKINKKSEFLLTPAITVNDTTTQGLINYFLEGEENESALFNVFVEFEDQNEKGDPKTSKEEFCLAAYTSREAYDIIQSFLHQIDSRNFSIKNIKFDEADEIFVSAEEHKSYVYKSESYGGL